MLEVKGRIVKALKAGVNVKAMHEDGTERKQTTQGFQLVPKFVPTYTEGVPFGAVVGAIPAPVDLKAGDVLIVDGSTGGALRVERDGEEVHTSDLQKLYREEAEDRDARREEIRRRRLENRI